MQSSAAYDSLPAIIKQIPKKCLRPETSASFSYLFRDLALVLVLGFMIVVANRVWIALPLSLILGLVLTGLFVIAHDAGHRSFSTSLWVNNIVGEVLSAILIWPFHVWRLSHDVHHKYTHHISKEVAWRPFSQEKVDRLSSSGQWIYLATRSWFFFLGAIFFAIYFVKDGLMGLKSRHFKAKDLGLIYSSVFFTAVITVGQIYLVWNLGGFFGFVFLFLIPQLVFQIMMSTFTYFHHTNPDSEFMEESTWTAAKAQLGSTIFMRYPAFIDWFTHDISWHVPHHVCVGVPHYRLREAHAALQAKYPEIVQQYDFNLDYVRNVLSHCQVAGERGLGTVPWARFDASEKKVLSGSMQN